uniref:Reverse transcriptase domain-containing protein n=1 Tax=Tanacetum cinerariifolium TaxID=118510 RepID=A0A6L2JN27_TANCI|nr:reverse transcriptase domain-containing protein [Tanacetum cinerariifolium]
MTENRTMEELLQAPTEGYGEAIVIPKINADHFEIKTNLLQLVQANPYHGFERENPHTHINNFKGITLTLKFRDVPNDVIKLMMFPYSLEGNARVWYDKVPPNSILTWEDLVNKFVNQFFPPSKNTHLKNEISHFTQRFEETFGEAWERFKEMLRACPHHGFMELTQIDTFYNDQDSLNATAGGNLLFDIFAKKIVTPDPVKAVEESCVTCGGNHAYYNCPNTDSNQPIFVWRWHQSSTSGTLLSNTIPNPKGEMKEITTRSGVAYEGPSIPTPKKATNQMEKFFQIFQDLHFNISFADALILMPKFASTIKSLLTNKDKLFELAKIPLNENCSAMLLKKLPEKLGDPGKFLIPCDFLGMDICHTLANLGASINLMPLSIWKKLSLPKLTPTRRTLELADRSITRPKGVAKDFFVKVGKFQFLTDFVVVNFEADPRVPLILGRSFLRTGRALIDVYGEEITLRVNDEAVTFNLNKNTRYSSTYDDLSVNRIDIIDVAREECAQEILGFFNNSSGGNPTSTFEPILSDSSLSLTPFDESDFILEEIDAYLKDESVSPEIDHADFKAKSSIKEPPGLKIKELPSHLEYAYLEGVDKLPVIISKDLKVDEKDALLKVLKYRKRAIAWKITDIKGIDPRFCTHKILMEEDYKPAMQSQRRVNLKIHEVIKKEVIKLLDAGMIYPISDSPWVSPIHCVPKKGRITVVENGNNELIPTRLVTGWRVCIDYRKLNDATRKDHFPLPFMDQIMPFGLCNAPGTFQRYMMVIFHDMIEKTMEVFMDEFLVFGDSFSSCLSHLDTMLQRSCLDVVAFVCVILSFLLEQGFSVSYGGPALSNCPNWYALRYKYGGQRNYKRITTHAYLVLSSTQIGVDTLGAYDAWYSILSAGRPTTAPRGGRTGRRTGRGGGRTGGRSGDQDNGRNDGQGGQVGGQGREVNNGVDGVPNFSTIIAQHLQNLLPTIVAQNNDHRGCTYKEFLACNPKEYDGKGDAIVYTRWIEKMESVLDMSGSRDSQKSKYTVGLFVGKALTWWNSQIHTQGREAAIGMSWEDFKTLTREEFYPSNEMQKLETELRNHAIVRAGHAAYTDRF